MTFIETQLIQPERDRCQALIAGDQERLRELMHPELFHVHARGNAESFQVYVVAPGTPRA